MAELYRRPKNLPYRTTGDPLAWAVARHVEVQTELELTAYRRAGIAAAKLASSRHSGASYIDVSKGDVDWHVALVDRPDKSGAINAMAIEVGARGGRGGVHALGTAFRETNVYYM